MRRLGLMVALGALIAAAAANVALAQGGWPTKPITMIVPYLAGGGADPAARLLAEGMSKRLGRPIVVDFKAGANGTIGTQMVANAAPDGYTILFTPPAPIVNSKYLIPNLPYNPEKDLVPIIEVTTSPMAIMANADFGPKTLKELIDYAKANPDKVLAGTPGQGGSGHLMCAMVEVREGVKFNMIPYRGTGGLLPDMLGGRLNISFDLPAAYVSHVNSGKVRIIAVMGDKRIPSFPDAPTSVESGYPQLQLSVWYALFAPKGVPQDIVMKLNAAANEALKEPEIKAKIEQLGYQTAGGTPEQMAENIRKEMSVVGEIVRLGNVKME
ncbi:Bug family tripartite tricarboxylate transporter substrate binding protein [Reyranella sp.]|uniref:Bug family tripartite tricarboxylate transporter substrate binding protein n=1 Tax=Reyranella sp. TaxID=1929291 RepID=UPI003783BE76